MRRKIRHATERIFYRVGKSSVPEIIPAGAELAPGEKLRTATTKAIVTDVVPNKEILKRIGFKPGQPMTREKYINLRRRYVLEIDKLRKRGKKAMDKEYREVFASIEKAKEKGDMRGFYQAKRKLKELSAQERKQIINPKFHSDIELRKILHDAVRRKRYWKELLDMESGKDFSEETIANETVRRSHNAAYNKARSLYFLYLKGKMSKNEFIRARDQVALDYQVPVAFLERFDKETMKSEAANVFRRINDMRKEIDRRTSGWISNIDANVAHVDELYKKINMLEDRFDVVEVRMNHSLNKAKEHLEARNSRAARHYINRAKELNRELLTLQRRIDSATNKSLDFFNKTEGSKPLFAKFKEPGIYQ